MDQRERWNDPEEALRMTLDGHQAGVWTTLPGIVVSRTGNNVSVQPALQGALQDKVGNVTNVNLPQLVNVPLVMTGGGGFGITMPIGVGDEVLVHFSARCIDGWWQNGGANNPQIEYRMHDLSDGFATPAPMSNPKALPNISSTSAQLRSHDGTWYVEVAAGGKVNIVGTSDISVTTTGNLIFTAANASLDENGNFATKGEITAMSSAADIKVSQHVHIDTQTGSGVSGIPQVGS